jgi:tetratricopeptide (TPR) repeat protein
MKEFEKEWVLEAKSAGNQSFSEKNYDAAIAHYSRALAASSWPREEIDLRCQLLCNRAQCFLNLDQPERCVQDCSEALAIRNALPKALFRRSLALKRLGKTQEAFSGL